MEGFCRGWGKVELDQTGACLALHKMQGPKQPLVYPRADCVALNRRLFTLAQTAWPQTGACLPSRRLHSPKQAPVWHYTKCRDLNSRLFTLAQAFAEAGKFILVPGQTSQPRQGPCCALRMALWWRERPPRGSGEGLLRGRGPIKISAGCLLLRPTKVF